MKSIQTMPSVLAAMAAAIAVASCGDGATSASACPEKQDIKFTNGRIHTMDDQNRVVSSVVMRGDKFLTIGDDGAAPQTNACQKLVDLQGRTVLPGLIDNHNHIVLLGLRPGYHMPVESAKTFDDVKKLYEARAASAPKGAFITTIGGFNPLQFNEKRLPNRAELDALAPNNPVYLQVSFSGPASTNSSGREFFQNRGVVVGDDGSIASNGPTLAALNALRAIQSFEDMKRSTREALAYAASLGLTTSFDMGGFVKPGLPGHDDQEEFVSDGAASWDPKTAYDPLMAIHSAGEMKSRVRIFFLSMDTADAVPVLSDRVRQFANTAGDAWLNVNGVGEFITNWPLFGQVTPPSNYPAAIRVTAQRGWSYQQHTLSAAEDDVALNAWEGINATVPLAPLRWSLAHVPKITPENIKRVKALGAGLAVHGIRYLAGTRENNGPPYRAIVDSGVKVGGGSDSAQIAPLSPWHSLYYMVTGKNSAGQLINEGQTLTREEAIRLYTRENGWFSKEETKLGSIEAGKLADLVVLDADYFTVPDEAIKQIRPVLTVVGGSLVHDTGALSGTALLKASKLTGG